MGQNINVLYYKVCEKGGNIEEKSESYNDHVLSMKPLSEGKHLWMTNEENFDPSFYTSFYENKKKIYQENRKEIMNVLLMENSQGQEHFALISNLDGLFRGYYRYDKVKSM